MSLPHSSPLGQYWQGLNMVGLSQSRFIENQKSFLATMIVLVAFKGALINPTYLTLLMRGSGNS
jgi:hypothetical protein